MGLASMAGPTGYLHAWMLLMALDFKKIWLQMAYMASKLLWMAKLAQYGT